MMSSDSRPTGTVSFLFTDIQGSARLAQEFPQELASLLEKHDVILNEAIQRHAGYVFRTIGDAFCASFHTAGEALEAALDAQRALQKEDWQPAAVRVRMGIHTGAATATGPDPAGGGYTGYLTLTRVQRVMSAAHGGQVLLSNPAAELLAGSLPAQVSLRDLGEHKLKGLANPERLWQVITPDLLQDFPPIQSQKFIPSNLPLQLTSFVGRRRELDEIRQLLAGTRLLTLTGVGGTGKTRLALQAAGQAVEAYPHGAWLVELAPLSDPELIQVTIAKTLGLQEETGRPTIETLLDYLLSRQLLLVLDNCEHLIDTCARFADTLLHACSQVSILATSREALGIAGEHIYPVHPLELPGQKNGVKLSEIAASEAVRLFVERASEVKPRFKLNEQNAAAVAQICRRLDGIPLALELAAARLKAMSPEMLAERLDDRFRLLSGGSRAALPRHQTLRAAIDWSYNLLDEPERRLLLLVSLFAGGFTLEAAEALYGSESFEVLDLLAGLVDKSLLVLEEHRTETRYRLLETIRQYGLEKLQEGGELPAVRRRFTEYYLAFAEAAEPQVRGPEQAGWLRRLEVELDNLRLAMEIGLVDDPQSSLRIASALWWFWVVKGHSLEGERWLKNILRKPENRARTIHRGRALSRLVFVDSDNFSGDSRSARRELDLAAEGLKICCELNDLSGQGYAHYFIGLVDYQVLGDYITARVHFDVGLGIFEKIQDLWGLARILLNQGIMAGSQGDLVTQIAYEEKSLSLCRAIGDQRGIAQALDSLAGCIATIHGDLHRGRSLAEEALEIYRQNELLPSSRSAHDVLAIILCWQGEYHLAEQVLGELIEIDHQSGIQAFVTFTYLLNGSLLCYQGRLNEGITLLEQNIWSVKDSLPFWHYFNHLVYALTCLGDRERVQDLLEKHPFNIEVNSNLQFYWQTLGLIALLDKKGPEARSNYQKSLFYAKKNQDKLVSIWAIEGYAWALSLTGERRQAARLLAAVEQFREKIGAKIFPVDRPMYDRVIAELKSMLGTEAYDQTWADGREMELEQAIELVLAGG